MTSAAPSTTVSDDDRPGSIRRTRKPTVVNRQKDRPGQFARIRGIFDQPTLWEYAATIPAQSPEGARRKFPTIFYVAMPALSAVWRSFSAAEVALAEDEMWHTVCEIVCTAQRQYRPQDEPFDLASLTAGRGITAQNFYDARRKWLAPHLEGLQSIFEHYAADAALETGMADPDGAPDRPTTSPVPAPWPVTARSRASQVPATESYTRARRSRA